MVSLGSNVSKESHAMWSTPSSYVGSSLWVTQSSTELRLGIARETMSDLKLECAATETDRTVLILAHDGPLAVGAATDGVNYLCSGCRRIVLQSVYQRQFLSIVI